MNKLPRIYCDMDGVLVDFEKNIVKYNRNVYRPVG